MRNGSANNELTLGIGYVSEKCAEKNEKANRLATAHSLGLATMIWPTIYQIVQGYQKVKPTGALFFIPPKNRKNSNVLYYTFLFSIFCRNANLLSPQPPFRLM